MSDRMAEFDLAIIGGGINGTGIARDAAGRGLRALLVEQNDLASGTSSASTKLIHGGLRYLEHGWFRLVREALIEREVMLRMAPHLIRPMRFVLPVEPGMRPLWMLRLGLFVYDHLGGRTILPATRSVDLAHGILGAPLRRSYARGFEYSDCWADDARLVVLNAVDAAADDDEVELGHTVGDMVGHGVGHIVGHGRSLLTTEWRGLPPSLKPTCTKQICTGQNCCLAPIG